MSVYNVELANFLIFSVIHFIFNPVIFNVKVHTRSILYVTWRKKTLKLICLLLSTFVVLKLES